MLADRALTPAERNHVDGDAPLNEHDYLVFASADSTPAVFLNDDLA